MNDFDKAIKILEKAQSDLFKAHKAITKFNDGLGLTEGQARAMIKMLDRIELAHNIVDGVVDTCVGLAPQFD